MVVPNEHNVFIPIKHVTDGDYVWLLETQLRDRKGTFPYAFNRSTSKSLGGEGLVSVT